MTVRAFVLTCTWVLAFAISTLAVSAGDSTSPPVAIQWKVNVDTKSAKKRSLLKDVIGSAGRGKLHALIGPSGSGKTTLLNILAGQHIPDTPCGFVTLSSEDIFIVF